MFRKDYTGKRFGILTVVSYAGKETDGHSKWLCRCDCGNEVVRGGHLLDTNKRKGTISSCGCRNRAKPKEKDHGHKRPKGESVTKQRLYHIWHDMKRRCTKPQNSSFRDYGGRGISVCDEWASSYENFKRWALDHGYSDDLSIDRIDKDGNYEPDNCRWADNFIQANNRRNNHFIEIDGEVMSMADVSRKYGVPYRLIKNRLNRGWAPQEAVFTPKGEQRGNSSISI